MKENSHAVKLEPFLGYCYLSGVYHSVTVTLLNRKLYNVEMADSHLKSSEQNKMFSIAERIMQ